MRNNIASSISKRIDHTLLKPGLTFEQVSSFVNEGVKYDVRGLVVSPSIVPIAKKILGSKKGIKLVSVVSFPFGENPTSVKLYEINELYSYGVDELDIVLNISYVKMGLWDAFEEEVMRITSLVRSKYPRLVIKLILEVSLLDREELSKAINIVNKYKPDYLKTSTGYGLRGTSVEDVRVIRSLLDEEIGIKASGGIRTFSQAVALIKAGADVIGSSRGVDIIKEALSEE